MTDPKGGFYTALDAETDAEEGAYYTWTETDIRQILKTDADFFLACYALAPMPEGEAGVLYKAETDSALAARHQIDVATLHARLSPLKEKLLNARAQRPRPLLDDKIITAWNGLMMGAYAALTKSSPVRATSSRPKKPLILSATTSAIRGATCTASLAVDSAKGKPIMKITPL